MATSREPLKGRDLQKGIIARARELGWRVAHTPPIKAEDGWRTAVAADGKGFPDLLFVRERVMVAEVKGDTDRLRPEQRAWLSAFRMAGVEAYCWTPDEWLAGKVEETLRVRRPTARLLPLLTTESIKRHLVGQGASGGDITAPWEP